MTPAPSVASLYDRFYPEGDAARPILLKHSGQVARLALDINEAMGLPLDPVEVDYAAALHDIGICRTDAPGIGCHICSTVCSAPTCSARPARPSGPRG